MKDYPHKMVFVAGGSMGIGLDTAKLYFTQGADVVIFARNQAKLEAAKNEIKTLQKYAGQKIWAVACDVSNYEAFKTAVDNVILESGAPEILITCVGGASPDYFENISSKQFDTAIKSNLYSAWNAAHILLPFMKEKGGNMVFVSSVAGFVGVFGYTDYCAAKFALIGFAESLAYEVEKYNIRISVLCPPDTDTPGYEAENVNKPAETKAISANAKLVSPQFVASQLVKGVEKDKFLIIPGFEGKGAWFLKRFFPGILKWMMKREISKVSN